MNEIIKYARVQMKRDTAANWSAVGTSFVPLQGEIIVYLDYQTDGNGVTYPGIKIGDGNAYLVDLPFVTENIENILNAHIADTGIHVTAAEKTFWNNKLNTHVNSETLVLCTYETN